MLSKREFERKMREEQEAAAYVFQDFINTFQDGSAAPSKTFVKSGVLYPETNRECKEARQLYNPKPIVKQSAASALRNAVECARILKEGGQERAKNKQEKPRSNLDLLKEELKQRHNERGERERLKEELDLSTPALSYFEGGDPNSTNLFVANLNSKITENHLMLEFGAYGPLASVKIMWPRGDERLRNSNCGFVAFMSRRDAERALRANKHRDDMRVGWGKSVELPSHPIYIPNELLRLHLPPPPSGLPFNAQPPDGGVDEYAEKEFDDLLRRCVVKVTVPLNRKTLALVHRMVEFVVREGPTFEAIIMNREMGNPEFAFLFDFQSPTHVYYRWKLFSVLNGDDRRKWSMQPFRMYKGGSIWSPPVALNFSDGMPDELVREKEEKAVDETRMSDSQCGRLVGLIRNLSMNRSKIAEATVFCLNHAASIADSVAVIVDSMRSAETGPVKKVARLYLLSDVLFNLKPGVVDVEAGDCGLLEVFGAFHATCSGLRTACDRDNFRSRVLRVLQHWNVCGIVSAGFARKAESLFLATSETEAGEAAADDDASSTDEPLDGANLLRRSLKNEVGPEVVTSAATRARDDADAGTAARRLAAEYFVPSKWDAVDPEEVEAQAMSTRRMYYMELEGRPGETGRESRDRTDEAKENKDAAGRGEKRRKEKKREAAKRTGGSPRKARDSRRENRSRKK